MHDKQFVSIIGAPRSGTTWLFRMMRDHPKVVAHNAEVTTFFRYIKPLDAAWRKESRWKTETCEGRGLVRFLEQSEFDALVAQFIEGVYAKLMDGHPECSHYVEKAPPNVFAVRLINTYIPDAKFIHLIRDGRDMALSQKSRIAREGRGGFSIALGAKKWKDSIIAARKASAFEGRYLELRYERLVSHCAEELRKVFDFCGLPADDDLVQQIADANSFSKRALSSPNPEVARDNGKAPWEQLMAPVDRYAFDRVAGDLLRELGYADGNWWRRNGVDATVVKTRWYLRRAGRRVRRGVGVLQGG